eukprot:TRINITY_DN6693_c0_g1_i1.p1 TRINITY_DN6693_c0_g1~~TRINITY_DN6693_c0_g1_i1.p1  ORF type:complete len:407 (+),score=70.59 TRINITY_DN6693_c0_g1_i1:58-1278(+)
MDVSGVPHASRPQEDVSNPDYNLYSELRHSGGVLSSQLAADAVLAPAAFTSLTEREASEGAVEEDIPLRPALVVSSSQLAAGAAWARAAFAAMDEADSVEAGEASEGAVQEDLPLRPALVVSSSQLAAGAAWARAAFAAMDEADSVEAGEASEGAVQEDLPLRPALVVSSSQLAAGAAWARAAFAAMDEADSVETGESSEGAVEEDLPLRPALVVSSSQLAAGAAWARAAFAAMDEADSVETGESSEGAAQEVLTLRPGLVVSRSQLAAQDESVEDIASNSYEAEQGSNIQPAFPSISLQQPLSNACDDAPCSIDGSYGEDVEADGAHSLNGPVQSAVAIPDRRQQTAHEHNFTRFAPSPQYKGVESDSAATPATAAASASFLLNDGGDIDHALHAEFERFARQCS